MTDTKEFELGTVLSQYSGMLLTEMDKLYEIANWMTGEPIWTHQLPCIFDETKPVLEEAFPWMKDVHIPKEGLNSFEKVDLFLEPLRMTYGATLQVPKIPEGQHEHKNPLVEMAEKVGADRVIPAIVPDPE